MPAILGGRLVDTPDELEALSTQVTWRSGLGAITHILGPTDQNLTIGAATGKNIRLLGDGFVPPCLTTAQKTAISSPTTGLVVYDLTLNKLCVYTGAAWETVSSAS